MTFQANLTNPVPSGQLLQPNGSALGMRTNLGASIGSATAAGVIPTDRINPEYWRYSLGIEKQFAANWLVELSYLGKKGSHVPFVQQINFVPQQFRTSSAIRDNTADVSQPGGRQPVPGPDARNAGQQWRDNRAPPVAPAASAVR